MLAEMELKPNQHAGNSMLPALSDAWNLQDAVEQMAAFGTRPPLATIDDGGVLMLQRLPTTIADWVAYFNYDDDFKPQPAAERTSARPGSQAKIEVMRLRVELGQSLYHRDDEPIPLPVRESSTGYVAGIREVAAMR